MSYAGSHGINWNNWHMKTNCLATAGVCSQQPRLILAEPGRNDAFRISCFRLLCSGLGSPTQCDELRTGFSKDELVRQEGQASSGGFVSDLIHHIPQRVDVSAKVLNPTKSTFICIYTSLFIFQNNYFLLGVPT